MNGNTSSPFNPADHLVKLNGKDYLEVVRRLQWLRAERPDAVITTKIEQVDFDAGWAIFHARVEIPGSGVAEGTGSETRAAFPAGWLEKAETIAVGRALAMLGFGTAFALADFEEGHLADAPVVATTQQITVRVMPSPDAPATEAQIKLIWIRAKTVGMSGAQVEAECRELFPNALGPRLLTKQQASRFIDHLQHIGAPLAEVRA